MTHNLASLALVAVLALAAPATALVSGDGGCVQDLLPLYLTDPVAGDDGAVETACLFCCNNSCNGSQMV
jgi:hypothetical protein